MLIAFILVQQWNNKGSHENRGRGGYGDGIQRHLPFCFVTVCPRSLFSLLLFDNWNRKIVQLCCTGCKRPKRIPWLKFSPISVCSTFPSFSFFFALSPFLFLLFVDLLVRIICTRLCVTCAVARWGAAGFAYTPRHDRGGASSAGSSPLKQGGNHNSLCWLFFLDIASNFIEQTTHPLPSPGWVPLGRASSAASCRLIAGCSVFDSGRHRLCQRGFLSTRLCFRFIFHSVTLSCSLFDAFLFVCYHCPVVPSLTTSRTSARSESFDNFLLDIEDFNRRRLP